MVDDLSSAMNNMTSVNTRSKHQNYSVGQGNIKVVDDFDSASNATSLKAFSQHLGSAAKG